MLDYEATDGCRMRFLQTALDDASAGDCGRCDGCAGVWFSAEIPSPAVDSARARLAQVGVELEPRSLWPSGMDRLGVPVKGKISAGTAMRPGRAVARLTDLGWGQRLRRLLGGPDSHVPPALAQAAIEALAGWGWERRPAAVVSVPSRRRPQLVTSLAEGLATVGRLPYLGSLQLIGGGPSGDPGGNSAFRLAGVWGHLGVGRDLADAVRELDGPVLLVDDAASSRWTLTVAAAALRDAGADDVLPFVLALDG